jgi:4-aminobutyrate aminotransferase-like enzyme
MARIRRAAFDRGVLLGSGGHADNVIKLCPPLTIDEGLLDAALDLTILTIRGTR